MRTRRARVSFARMMAPRATLTVEAGRSRRGGELVKTLAQANSLKTDTADGEHINHIITRRSSTQLTAVPRDFARWGVERARDG